MTRFRFLTLAGILAFAVPAFAQTAPPVGPASSFAVLAGTSVTNTGASTFNGDVGVFPGTMITGVTSSMLATGAALHEGDAVAAMAQAAAALAYDDIDSQTCPLANDLDGVVFGGGLVLTPGVYCFDTDAALTGNLVLSGAGPWIFQVGGNLTTAAASTITASVAGLDCQGSGVFWHVAGTASSLGASSTFVGTLLAANDVTVGAGAIVDGRVVSLDESVTLESSTVTACTSGRKFPFASSIGMTGGGQISVPDPDSTDPAETGTGRANYGFNATPGAAGAATTGHLNYRNHVTGLHVNGQVTDVAVLDVDADGLPKTARFSGTCQVGPPCTFVVVAEDNGEPGRDDQFGILVMSEGDVVESRAVRVVNNGNIQAHTSLTTEISARELRVGQQVKLKASLVPGQGSSRADAYVVLQLPNGQYLSWTGSALVPGLVPIARSITPGRFAGTILQTVVPAGTTPGAYKWMSGLTSPGTLNLVSDLSETPFVIKP